MSLIINSSFHFTLTFTTRSPLYQVCLFFSTFLATRGPHYSLHSECLFFSPHHERPTLYTTPYVFIFHYFFYHEVLTLPTTPCLLPSVLPKMKKSHFTFHFHISHFTFTLNVVGFSSFCSSKREENTVLSPFLTFFFYL